MPPPRPQERMHVVWQELVNSGLLSPSDYVRVTSTAAAQIFNIYPRKGVVSCCNVTVADCALTLSAEGGGLDLNC